MATPSYFGAGQPVADNGGSLLGRLGSFFGGGGTPQYLGDGQPSTTGRGYLGTVQPAYKLAPAAQAPVEQNDESSAREACGSCPIDPEALAAGNIAIVIPRQGI